MNSKKIIIGVTIGIIAAILWSVVFINVLNERANPPAMLGRIV